MRPPPPQNVLDELGGVAHRSSLVARDVTPYALRRSVASGAVTRVRRDWFATRDAPEQSVLAVQVGGRVSCITALSQCGVWVVSDDKTHVRVEPTASRLHNLGDNVCVHWRKAAAPSAGRAQDSVKDALAVASRCISLEYAVAACDSALNQRLITRRDLNEIVDACGRRMRKIASLADGRADSGIESIPRVRLALLGIEMVPQVRIDGHRVDGLIGEKLVLQFDGYGPHSSAWQRNKDLREDARLALREYTVLRFSYDHVMYRWPWVLDSILAALEKGLHMA